jgi:hypothetical protein
MHFSGEHGINVYQATALAGALKLYALTGMKVNRAHTPKAMLARASELTGQTFKRGEYLAAARALLEYAERERALCGPNDIHE